MKAITYQKARDAFTLSELKVPEIEQPFDVLVKVHAVGLNPVDAKIHLWHGMGLDMDDNFVTGLDVSGEIVALGDSVTGWQVGDKVLYHGNMRRAHGGFAEFAIQDSRSLVTHPQTSAEVAAASPCAAWTAYRALFDKLSADKRSSVFIAGGAGGVGSFAIQLAKLAGINTIITTASEANHDFLKTLGATHTIDYRQGKVAEQVMQITADLGVEIALDCVGGDNDILCASVLGYEGEMVELVNTVNPQNYNNAFLQGLSFHQLSLGSGHVNSAAGRATLFDSGTKVSALLSDGSLQVPELTVISMEQIGDALMKMRDQRTVGKIVAKFV